MKLDVSTWMMIFFILFLILSIWKVYKFLPNRVLKDDDTTEESHEELKAIVFDVLKNFKKAPDLNELHTKVREHNDFDSEHFWRFNQNKLNQLLNKHYIENKHLCCIEDIHKELHEK